MRELTVSIQVSDLFEVKDYTLTEKELQAFKEGCIRKVIEQVIDRENLENEYIDAEWDTEIKTIEQSPEPPEHFSVGIKEARWVGNGIMFYNEHCKIRVKNTRSWKNLSEDSVLRQAFLEAIEKASLDLPLHLGTFDGSFWNLREIPDLRVVGKDKHSPAYLYSGDVLWVVLMPTMMDESKPLRNDSMSWFRFYC